MVEKIISGGQTGVDRAALDFAIASHIPHGGACPKGRVAEDGVISNKYHLYEIGDDEPGSPLNNSKRTIENIIQSDATLIVVPNYPMPSQITDGTQFTIDKAIELNKPHFIFTARKTTIKMAQDWLESLNVRVLNIAGLRESNSPGIYQQTYDLLIALFSQDKS